MKTFIIQIVALLIVIFVALGVGYNSQLSNNLTSFISRPQDQSAQRRLKILAPPNLNTPDQTKSVVNVEVVDTKEERSLGLGNRDSIASDSGMLFIFDKTGKYNFWMKDMKFPIDFIWIRGSEIVDLLPNVPPPADSKNLPIYTSNTEIDKVLEVNAGFIQNNNIQVGDRIELETLQQF